MTAKRIIQAIMRNDPAVRTRKEAWLYPGLWAVLHHRLANKLYRSGWFFLARFVSQRARRRTGIEIHPGATIGHGLFIDHGAGVVIGETCVIGDDVIIFHGVTLGGTGKETGKRHPTVEDGAFISAGATILGNVNIGAGAKIGTNAIVLKDVPAGDTVVCEPARNTRLEASLRNEIAVLKEQIEALKTSAPHAGS